MAIEHLSDKDLDVLEKQGIAGLSDQALDLLELPKGYGMAGGRAEQPTYPEEQYMAQNPGARALNVASQAATDPQINPVVGYGAVMQKAADMADAFINQVPGVKSLNNLVGTIQSETAKLGGPVGGPLGALAKFAPRSIGEAGGMAVDPAKLASGAAFTAKQGLGKLNKMVTNPASRETIEKGLGKFASARAVMGEPGFLARHARGLAEKEEAIKGLEGTLSAKEAEIALARKAMAETPGSVAGGPRPADVTKGEYGSALSGSLDAITEARKKPLAAQRDKLVKRLQSLAPAETKTIISKAYEVKDDLIGYIETSQNAKARSIIKKYLKLEDDPKLFPEGRPTAEVVRPEDLLQDASALGEAGYAIQKSNPKQARAILQLKKAVESTISKAAAGKKAGSKSLNSLIKKDKSEWSKFYQEQFSETAEKMRRTKGSKMTGLIFESEEAIQEAKKALGDDFRFAQEEFEREFDALLDKTEAPRELYKQHEDILAHAMTPGGKERLLKKVSILESQKENEKILAKLLKEREEIQRQLAAEQSRQVGNSARRKADDPRYLGATRQEDIGVQANLRLTSAGLAAGGMASGNPYLAGLGITAGLVGMTPEALARMYMKAPRATKVLMDDAFKASKKLGKAAGMHPSVVAVSRMVKEQDNGQ